MRQNRRRQERERLKNQHHRLSRKGRFPQWLLWTIVGLVASGSLVAVILASSGVFNRAGSSAPAYALTSLEVLQIASRGHSEGHAQAPITIVEFSDFQCPYCKMFRSGPLQQIEREFLDSGQIRIVYRHYAFLGAESFLAAEASECAADQGQFWPYHDLLFREQGAENAGTFTQESLAGFANELGLDTEQFTTCLESQKHHERVLQSSGEARSLGIRGTPTVFVNGRFIQNTMTADGIRQVIEDELKRAS